MAPAINAVIAQRLVRKPCSKCAEEYKPSPEELEKIREIMKGVTEEVFEPSVLEKEDLKLIKAVGCESCNNSGYYGRVAVFEIFSMKGEIEELTTEGANTREIREAALRQGMTTITQDAVLKMLDQRTTMDEVKRVGEA